MHPLHIRLPRSQCGFVLGNIRSKDRLKFIKRVRLRKRVKEGSLDCHLLGLWLVRVVCRDRSQEISTGYRSGLHGKIALLDIFKLWIGTRINDHRVILALGS